MHSYSVDSLKFSIEELDSLYENNEVKESKKSTIHFIIKRL